MSAPAPSVVAFVGHASGERLSAASVWTNIAELVLTHHDQRQRNAGEADWIVRASGVTIVYDWPDGHDSTTALVISAWRE